MSRKAFIGAMRTRQTNRFKRAYYGTLARTHDQKHARLTCQRKLLSTLLAMWKNGTEYDDCKEKDRKRVERGKVR